MALRARQNVLVSGVVYMRGVELSGEARARISDVELLLNEGSLCDESCSDCDCGGKPPKAEAKRPARKRAA